MSIHNQDLTNLVVIEERKPYPGKNVGTSHLSWCQPFCYVFYVYILMFYKYIYGISLLYLNSCEWLPNEIQLQHMSVTFMNLNKSCLLLSLPSPSWSLYTAVDKHLWTANKSGHKRNLIFHWIKFLLIDFWKINYWSTFLCFHYMDYGEPSCHVFS